MGYIESISFPIYVQPLFIAVAHTNGPFLAPVGGTILVDSGPLATLTTTNSSGQYRVYSELVFEGTFTIGIDDAVLVHRNATNTADLEVIGSNGFSSNFDFHWLALKNGERVLLRKRGPAAGGIHWEAHLVII